MLSETIMFFRDRGMHGDGRRGRGGHRRDTMAAAATTTIRSPVKLAHDQVALRAYDLWERQGSSDTVANWFEAERQLKAERGQTPA